MKITFFSNYLNHHQLPFCLEMIKLHGNDFKFVATTPINQERLSLGYEDMNKKYSFVVTTYDSSENYEKAIDLALKSDVIIHGSAPEEFIKKRMQLNKLTFRYSERIFRHNVWKRYFSKTLLHIFKNHTIYKNKNLYMLCASAYTPYDYAAAGAYLNKTYKWGYFPEVIIYDNIEKLIEFKHPSSILWVARLIEWKHPEIPIYIANRLKNDGYTFNLNIIGIGEMESQLKNMISKMHLDDCVHMLGSMKPENVRKYMEQSQIFLFTSDRREGWGAVLNESMNSGCAVIANHAIGSVPFLLKSGENGLIYKNGDKEDVYQKVKLLLDNSDLCKKYGINAYKTMANFWNPKTATERFSNLAKQLLRKDKFPDIYESGPCSKAKILKDNWWYKS